LVVPLAFINDFFGESIPFITGWAFANPFCGLIAAIGTKKGRF
jgi:hypothetical protein